MRRAAQSLRRAAARPAALGAGLPFVGAAVLAAAIWVAAPTATAGVSAPVARAAGGKKTLTVSSHQSSWLATGVQIPKGESVDLKIAKNGATCHEGGAPDCPIGSTAGDLCSSNPVMGAEPPGPAGDAVPYGAYAYRVGSNGTPRALEGSATATGPGELYLVYNDCAPPTGYADNAGAATIVVSGIGKKPTLTVSVSLSRSGVSVGKSVEATVRVTAGKVPLSGVSLGEGLAGAGDVAEVTKRPLGLSGFSLAAGASKSFSFTVKALKAGAAALRARATANSQYGPASGQGAATLRVAKAALAVTMSTSPKRVKLKLDADGKVVPAHVQVTVRLTNTGTSALKAVSLQSVNPEPVVRTQPLNQLRLPHGSLPVGVGTLAAGSAVTRKFSLKVTGDGKYQLAALALFDDNGATGRAYAVGGRFEATVPLLYFAPKLEKTNTTVRNGASWVKAGKSWYVTGEIKNESSYRRLCIAPLIPTLNGNAAATGPVDIEKTDLRKGGPFAGTLEPGDSTALSMFVDTSAVGGTRSQVTLKPVAKLLPQNGKCTFQTIDGLKKIKPSNLVIPKPGADFTVHVDVSAPLAAPSSAGKNTVEFFGGIAQNLFLGFCHDILGIVAQARSVASDPALLTPQGMLAAAQIRAAQLIYTATEVYANYWRTASAAEKQSLLDRTASVLSRVGSDFWGSAKGTVEDAAKPWMDQMQAAYAKGDQAEIWHLWGQATGSGVHQALLLVFNEVLGAKLAASGPELEQAAATDTKAWQTKTDAALADEPARAKLPPEATLKTAPPGAPMTPADNARLLGIDNKADGQLAAIAKRNHLNLGVRGRSVASIDEIEKGSVWKPENMKPKNVNQIDIDWLGFRKRDYAQVRFRTYTDRQVAAITERIRNSSLTTEQKLVVFNRFETRLHEEKLVSKIEGYSERGQINVGFRYRPNGIDRVSETDIRKFDLESSPIGAEDGIPAGGTYYTPYQENPDYAGLAKSGELPPNCIRKLLSVLCTITGDIDGVYVTRADGGPVDQKTLFKVYKELQKVGWQHGDTLYWIDDEGRFMFGKKEAILSGVSRPEGEVMVEYGADGKRRVVVLNLKESKLIDRNNFYLRVEGGYAQEIARTP